MSVSFFVSGDADELNVSNSNARDLLSWLGYHQAAAGDLYGELPARDLAARCRRRLWPEVRNLDPAIAPVVERLPGEPLFFQCGRPEGYLRDRTEQLLALAERAGDGVVHYS
ncbi:hypothetical protein QEG98_42095 (plasmid) [Myxococcus sp. MxC21-1]|uniref:hypothetical protein n=1 Tax=Myxococcus sp. MxC21-1 TaxID=3041439 RepID=UPI00292CE6BC|nr:hypothetical protein [Myxococcus sp. MxC21-1]WNZ66213.1 hypothetical protein QEG98_42095 [Myxococcus sp. MxC21-1]